MAAGDVEVYGPFGFSEIDAGLTGNGIVVADTVLTVRLGKQFGFVIIKAA